MTLPDYNLLVVTGPTASGKTRLAITLARELHGEIISADSRQVFRGMDIGTGKDIHEYGEVRCHLIDILEPGGEFSLFSFQKLFLSSFADITARGSLPLLCGGTGMYLDAALRGYRMQEVPRDEKLRGELAAKRDSELMEILLELRPGQHNRTDTDDRERCIRAIEIALHQRGNDSLNEPFPEIRPLILGIRFERSLLRQRITERLRSRLENGMVEEVIRLRENGLSWESLDRYGLEYRFIGAFLKGEMEMKEMFSRLNSAIHDFAKRQETWFRRMERNGVIIHWLNGSDDPLEEARSLLGL